MAYTPVFSRITGQSVSADEWGIYIKDNFAAGVPDIFTTKGDLAVGTAADTAARLGVGTTGYVLLCASAEATGLIWSALPLAVAAAAYSVSAELTLVSASHHIIDYSTLIYDDDTAVTVGAAWKYTVPAAKGGYFFVTATLLIKSSTAWGEAETAILELYKNNALYCYLCQFNAQVAASAGFQVFLSGGALIELVATDYIDVRVYNGAGATLTSDASTTASHISIARLF
jgi:hypothetical protein